MASDRPATIVAVKRRDLERHLREHGLIGEGANHAKARLALRQRFRAIARSPPAPCGRSVGSSTSRSPRARADRRG